jgi:hypothetical protein
MILGFAGAFFSSIVVQWRLGYQVTLAMCVQVQCLLPCTSVKWLALLCGYVCSECIVTELLRHGCVAMLDCWTVCLCCTRVDPGAAQ